MEQRHRQTQSQIQKLALTPQVKLYLKLLQQPLLELKDTLMEEMNQNPALEEDLKAETLEAEPADEKTDDLDIGSMEKADEEPSLPDLEENSLVEIKELGRRKSYQESLITQEETLFEHIRGELRILNLSDEEKEWVELLIGSLDENGFLKSPIRELAIETGASEAQLEELLKKLQSLETRGIFARDLPECLLIQLADKKDPRSELAMRMIRDHFSLVQKKAFHDLARELQAPTDDIRSAFRLIQECDPKPGKSYAAKGNLAVLPDAVVTFENGNPKKYQIDIRTLGLPRLKLSPEYRKMLRDKSLDKDSKIFVKDKVTQAEDLLEALKNRESTLDAVLHEVLKHQKEFLEKGFGSLKPLRMKDVAERLGVHESTVSRAVSSKYVQTPLGTFPVKSFFSGNISSGTEQDESQKSVMEKIRVMIRSENSKRPLSDQKIAELLAVEGIKIARRTVAKYRELLKFLPTNLRRER